MFYAILKCVSMTPFGSPVLPLAETIRKPASHHTEKHEGHGKRKVTRDTNNHCQQQVQQDVVTVGTLKLRNDQCPKAALTALHVQQYWHSFYVPT